MPIHDWTRVDAGIFHAFHHGFITEISRALNRGLLPSTYYALPEQIAGGLGPDVLTLHRPNGDISPSTEESGGIATRTAPQVQWHLRAEPDLYAAKAKAVVVRHTSDHRVIAVAEIVSPGNKNSRHGLRSFVSKAVELVRTGIHLLIVDLFPPGPRDPQGLHKLIWDEFVDNEFTLPAEQPLLLAGYLADRFPEAFLEPTSVGKALIPMPLFITLDDYVNVPLEATYQAAFEGLPDYWRNVLTQSMR